MISIIIPAFKEEKWIADTIRQFKALSIPHEVIVSDGRSPDRTVEIAKLHTDKVVVYSGVNKHNAAIGRNDGAKMASGDILVFIDASGVIPNINAFFARALAFFEHDQNLVALNVYQWIAPNETWMDRIILWLTNTVLRIQNNLLRHGMGSGKFMMMRRSAFERVGGFREELAVGEDGDIVNRLAKIGRTYIDPSLYILYPGRREHQLGWTRLLWSWTRDWTAVRLFGKAKTDQWKAVR